MQLSLRSLLLGIVSLMLLSGCWGVSSSSSTTGTNGITGGGGNSGGGGTIGTIGGGGVNGTDDSVIATPSTAGTVYGVVGASQTLSITFNSSDGRAISGFALTNSALPAGWSGPANFTCALVSTGSGCVLHLTFAPPAYGPGSFSLNCVFVDNAGEARTPSAPCVTINYFGTTNDNVISTTSPPGQISVIAPTGSQPVSVTFTTDDGHPATNFVLTSSLTSLPPGWSSAATSLVCATLSTGNSCQLNLVYAPTVYGMGTLTLGYSYDDDSGTPKTGQLNIAYAATTNNNIVGTPTPNSLAVSTNTSTPVNIVFTTDDGNPASNLLVTSSLTALPSGWTSASGSFSCATVSAGTACQLGLTYAPTAIGSGTLSLTYSYADDSGTAKTGSVGIPYSAVLPHLYVTQLGGPLYYCTLNVDGTLAGCAATGNGFSAPTGIAFNANNFAYVTDYYNSAVYVCNVLANAGLSACASTGSNFQNPWQLAINGNTLYATSTTGGVTTCAINVDGTLSTCVESAGSGVSGIAVSSSYAYLGVAATSIDVCAVGATGSLSGCTATGSGFVGADGISLAGGYAYVANQGNGTVNVCTIDSDGTLSGCVPSTVGGQPSDVVITGSQAYVDDALGNIDLCTVGTGGALTNCAASNGGTTFDFGIQIAIH
jgi:hypothetical protein